MARNEIVIDAPPEKVYEVLLDPSAYPKWVVGAKQLRGVDRRWPRTGARFHHKVGAGAVTLNDSTKLLEKKENRRVVLEVRIRSTARSPKSPMVTPSQLRSKVRSNP